MQDCTGVIRVYQRNREFCSKAQKRYYILYGYVHSSLVWYITLIDKPNALGLRVNDQDICVMNITDSQVNQVIIFIHVDDIVLTAKTSCVNLRLYLGS